MGKLKDVLVGLLKEKNDTHTLETLNKMND